MAVPAHFPGLLYQLTDEGLRRHLQQGASAAFRGGGGWLVVYCVARDIRIILAPSTARRVVAADCARSELSSTGCFRWYLLSSPPPPHPSPLFLHHPIRRITVHGHPHNLRPQTQIQAPTLTQPPPHTGAGRGRGGDKVSASARNIGRVEGGTEHVPHTGIHFGRRCGGASVLRSTLRSVERTVVRP